MASGTCWLTDDWNTPCAQVNCTGAGAGVEKLHVSGWKPAPGEAPPVAPGGGGGGVLCADGDCDCGPGLPCGEYLWDHRNQSLRTWLLDEFVGGAVPALPPWVISMLFGVAKPWVWRPARRLLAALARAPARRDDRTVTALRTRLADDEHGLYGRLGWGAPG